MKLFQFRDKDIREIVRNKITDDNLVDELESILDALGFSYRDFVYYGMTMFGPSYYDVTNMPDQFIDKTRQNFLNRVRSSIEPKLRSSKTLVADPISLMFNIDERSSEDLDKFNVSFYGLVEELYETDLSGQDTDEVTMTLDYDGFIEVAELLGNAMSNVESILLNNVLTDDTSDLLFIVSNEADKLIILVESLHNEKTI